MEEAILLMVWLCAAELDTASASGFHSNQWQIKCSIVISIFLMTAAVSVCVWGGSAMTKNEIIYNMKHWQTMWHQKDTFF